MKTNRDRRVDAYIEKSAEFAKPVLRHLRELVHEGCPDIREDIKWNMPFFLHHGILCTMAAFKAHCVFGFWHHGMDKPMRDDGVPVDMSMGSLGRITSIKQLPTRRAMLRYLREAAKLNESGLPPRPPRAKSQPAPKAPADLAAALGKDKAAAATYAKFTPGKQRDYVDWLKEAKRPETRAKRLATAIEWMSEGKPLNWKYR